MGRILSLVFTSLIAFSCFAQTQTIKGQVVDAQGEYPLIGASVIVMGTDPILGAATDVDGNFTIENVQAGRRTIAVQYVGYKSVTLPNVLVTTGKEVILNIKLEESVEKLTEIVVTASADKDVPLNEMAKVSARTFSIEEVTRFSGGRNDPARLAASFAGVSAPNDSRNDIVVRGNSPVGLLWRIEGIPMATTNHFATLGTTGGPVNALNTNLLRTSDFLTGAFPAEYGNANAAVFDVNFRNGNPDTYEFTGQLSAFSGLEFMAEGPISRSKGSTFVSSYRYGIASVAAPGTNAVPYYQDFSFKLNFGETKLGRIELFGIGGLSSIDFFGDKVDKNDLFANPGQDAFANNQLGLVGISNTIRFNKSAFLKTTLGASTNFNEYLQDNIVKDNNDNVLTKYRSVNVRNRENRITFSSVLNKKFTSQWNLRAGILIERYLADFFAADRDNRVAIPDADNDNIPDFFITTRNLNSSYNVSQAFAQVEHRFTDNFTTTAGIHTQYHDFTRDLAVEPRIAATLQVTPAKKFSIAYGLHAQSVPSPILFFEKETSPGIYTQPNSNLGFMKSHQVVFAYDQNLGPNWRLKAEAYYQNLFDIPVELTPSSYSIINEGADFTFDEKGFLVNNGKGTNYGVEMTLEKFFSRGFYLLSTTSLYNSKYRGSDNIERNTAFNNQFVQNVLFGKEWKFGPDKRNAWTFDSKLTTSGGKPYTPVDLDATRVNAGREVRMENIAYSERYANYFRWDVKFGMRVNSKRKKISHQFFVDLQNITNHQNEFVRRYNEVTDEINLVKQIGFFPDMMYRIQF